MKLSLAFSPCPNDTFIFDALVNGKVDTEGLSFEVGYHDVETLNQKAFRGELDVTKLSFHAFAHVANTYALLDTGSALGFGVGPLLLTKNQVDGSNPDLKVAIPGKYTTANLLLSLAYPHLSNKVEMVFSAIEEALLTNEVDLGVIIHENRFTYQDKGLHKVADLGEFWEQTTGCAIPLGGIVINRNLEDDVKLKVNRVLRRSVEYAFENPKSGLTYIKSHAQSMNEAVMYQHIELYVNKYSLDLGEEGRKAIQTLFDKAEELRIIPKVEHELFLSYSPFKRLFNS